MSHKKACFGGEWWQRVRALGTAVSRGSTYTNESSWDRVALAGWREEEGATSGESFEA